MAAKKEKQYPSRIKYEQNHPTVSARLPIQKHDKLLALLQKQGITLPQLLLHFIDEYEIKIMTADETRKAGYEEAKKTYMVKYLCNVCNHPIAITGQQAKDMAGKYMTRLGWGHKECHEKESLHSKAR